MKKKNSTLALFGFILTFLTFQISLSQVTQEWIARYNGPGDSTDQATSMAVDNSGNVYVTGFSYGSGSSSDYLTIKYNQAGDTVWSRRYNGPGNKWDEANAIAVDTSGNVYVTGSSTGSGGIYFYTDYATIKYNSNGGEEWVRRYNGPGNLDDVSYSIAIDRSGYVYVTGGSHGNGTSEDYATIKYNANGSEQWVKRYTDFFGGRAFSVAVDRLGNVYVTGSSWDGGASLDDYLTIKYNSSGVLQWEARYNYMDYFSDAAYGIVIDSSGDIYVNGTRGTIKYNSEGIQQGSLIFGGNGPKSTALDYSGNFYATGFIYGGTSNDYITKKYNAAGVQQWSLFYNGPEDSIDIANCIAVDDYGNAYVTGRIDGSYNLSGDYGTIKYNSQGVMQWIERYDGPVNSYDEAVSIAIDGSGNVYVTGKSIGNETGYDYATIKYSQSTGISQISSGIPENFTLLQNYPNPFNPVTNLEFGISDLGFVSLKVYDILGKEVATLVNEKLSPGKYKVEFDGSGLTSGVYFYRITAGEFTDTKRMLLVK